MMDISTPLDCLCDIIFLNPFTSDLCSHEVPYNLAMTVFLSNLVDSGCKKI